MKNSFLRVQIVMIMRITLFILFLFVGISSTNAQSQYMTRTAHIHVHSSNNIKDITADNYQVRGTIDASTGEIGLTGLLKSFEFTLGALDRAFNSSKINVSQFPKFTYEGRIANFREIDFKKPGVYDIEVKGKLFLWDEKRFTTANGQIEVMSDGSLRTESAFVMTIEEKNVDKINTLMAQKLPDVIAIDMNTFGVSRNIDMRVNAVFKPLNN